MKNLKPKTTFTKKIILLFEHLTSKPIIGGLYISDSIIQYLVLGAKPKALSIKLPPGVVREGKILNLEQFEIALKQLHSMVTPEDKGKQVPVIVTLPSGSVYTQSFQIPNVGREKLEESGKLNLQMISPISEDKAYMSFQVIDEMTDKFDLLGAISERKFVDDIRVALEKVNFSPIIFEFPGLSLSRVVIQTMGTKLGAEPSIIFQISSDGLNLSIIRNRNLYFDYFRSWTSIQGDERQISRELFENVVAHEIQKVMNFSLSRFKESVKHVFLVAPGFEAEIQKFAKEKFGLNVIPFNVPSWSLTPHWFVVFGSALRGSIDRSKDNFITLSNISSSELFKEDQTINFIILWRNIITGVLAVFLVLYGGIAYFLSREYIKTKENLSIFNITKQQKDLSLLQQKAKEFNSLVSTIKNVKSSSDPWGNFFSRIEFLTNKAKVVIDSMNISSLKNVVSINAHAPDNNSVTSFRTTLSNQEDFSNVNLKITSIHTLEDGSIGFSISFKFSPKKIEKK